ncbi:MAG: tRNA pseudouridine(13) synthase TruD [Halofilum sp. (in: g-proteobacteria)]|nr:tRNA pseudouridine(13) synthase TruD [Halofilum sp. (in: g-proteobacteria)]
MRHARKLRPGTHRANRFVLRVRALDADRGRLVERLRQVAAGGFPNYFGPQRFGRDGENLRRARAALAGDAGRGRVRGIQISAARSWLFNRVLERRVAEGSWTDPLPGDALMLAGTHSLFEYDGHDRDVPARVAGLDLDVTGPLLGPRPAAARRRRRAPRGRLARRRGRAARGSRAHRRARRPARVAGPAEDLRWEQGATRWSCGSRCAAGPSPRACCASSSTSPTRRLVAARAAPYDRNGTPLRIERACMEPAPAWLTDPAASAGRALVDIAAFLPNLFLAVVLGLAGWLAARVARLAVQRAGAAVNRALERIPVRQLGVFSLSPVAIRVLGDLAFWVVAFLFLVGIASVLELTAVGDWLARLASYLPAVLAGALIIVLGVAASILLGQLAAAGAAPAGAQRARLVGRLVQGTMLTIAIVLGVGQMGLDMTLPVALIVVLAATVAGALALAFALGAGDLVRDLIGAHGLAQHCEPRQRVRIDAVEGEVVELTATSVIVATAEGRVIVPARVFHERAVVLLAAGDDD